MNLLDREAEAVLVAGARRALAIIDQDRRSSIDRLSTLLAIMAGATAFDIAHRPSKGGLTSVSISILIAENEPPQPSDFADYTKEVVNVPDLVDFLWEKLSTLGFARRDPIELYKSWRYGEDGPDRWKASLETMCKVFLDWVRGRPDPKADIARLGSALEELDRAV